MKHYYLYTIHDLTNLEICANYKKMITEPLQLCDLQEYIIAKLWKHAYLLKLICLT